MHIAESVLSSPVLIAGAAGAAGGTFIGLRRLDYERLPTVAVISAAFFVASLVHVPVGLSSAHLVLNGLAGIVLGWAAFPALLGALLLQAILFGFGGLTVLGVNTVVMAAPAVACRYLFGWGLRSPSPAGGFALGLASGAVSVAGSGLLVAAALMAGGREFTGMAGLFFLSHAPVMVADGVLTGFVVAFLLKVRPELLAPGGAEPGKSGKACP